MHPIVFQPFTQKLHLYRNFQNSLTVFQYFLVQITIYTTIIFRSTSEFINSTSSHLVHFQQKQGRRNKCQDINSKNRIFATEQ